MCNSFLRRSYRRERHQKSSHANLQEEIFLKNAAPTPMWGWDAMRFRARAGGKTGTKAATSSTRRGALPMKTMWAAVEG